MLTGVSVGKGKADGADGGKAGGVGGGRIGGGKAGGADGGKADGADAETCLVTGIAGRIIVPCT